MSISEEPPIRLAKPEDFNAMSAIMDRANQYALDKSGQPQWTTMDHARNELRTHLNQGNCYVMRDKRGRINALMTLTEKDLYSWGEEGKDQKALYFHKLMKDPANAPTTPGIIFISFAASEALRRGKILLRCDAMPSMEKLIAYYETLGFSKKRFTQYPTTGKRAVLLEANPTEVLKRIASL